MIAGTRENVVKVCKALMSQSTIPMVEIIWNKQADLRKIIEQAIQGLVDSGSLVDEPEPNYQGGQMHFMRRGRHDE